MTTREIAQLAKKVQLMVATETDTALDRQLVMGLVYTGFMVVESLEFAEKVKERSAK